ncbi:MAG TPA: ATP-binding protein, partial [Polyangiales bacterium]
ERPINLRDVVQGVAAGVRARAEVRELALLVEVNERVPPLLLADPIKLAQVLTNLCSNAIKYTARGWIKLWVTMDALEHGKAKLRLGVKDSGAGIPARDLPALYEAFTHVSKEGSARVRSTGLGLSICKRILGLYQSQLLVESVEGSGSNFFFELSLPIAELPAERHMLRDLTRTHTLQGVRVLVAAPADTPRALNAQLVTRLLERWGADFDLVDSGPKALEQVKHQDYDLVLMDTELEAGSSRTTRAIRELASDEPAPLPIIALGPNSGPGQHERLAGQGFTDFVDEPLESELLFRSIVRHASLHRALRGETEQGHKRRTPGRC